jgi:hypothetical protein
MPYIKSGDGRREALQKGEPALTAGELNYQIFYFVKHCPLSLENGNLIEAIKMFVKEFLGDKPNYQKYNDMTGALVRCYVEIDRRLKINANFLLKLCFDYDNQIADYEDEKIISNGDVE